MEITINKQHTQSVNIPVPCYWKSHFRWIGLIDEKTVITFRLFNNSVEISSHILPETGKIWLESAIVEDFYELATEEEYFEAYDQAIKSITITPILKTW